MASTHPRPSLQTILAVDAVGCLAMGGLLILAAGTVADLTDLPQPLLFWAGITLLPVAGFMAFHAKQETVQASAASLAVFGNAAWAVASILLPVAGFVEPNALGWLFLIAQAAFVAALAWFEHRAARLRAKNGPATA